MTRLGKQEERRHQNPKKRKPPTYSKTGPKKDNLEKGYKEHANALTDTLAFIPKIKKKKELICLDIQVMEKHQKADKEETY